MEDNAALANNKGSYWPQYTDSSTRKAARGSRNLSEEVSHENNRYGAGNQGLAESFCA